MKIEHTPTSAIPGEVVICYCNHTAHPARLTNATVINFLPTNENFELLLPSPLVGAHMQLEVFPAPLWEQSGPHKTQIQWDACPPRCRAHPKSASPPSCSSSGLTWQHPAARQALTPPGEGRAAHQRPGQCWNLRWSCTQPRGKRGPGPTAQHSQAVTQDKNKPAANI